MRRPGHRQLQFLEWLSQGRRSARPLSEVPDGRWQSSWAPVIRRLHEMGCIRLHRMQPRDGERGTPQIVHGLTPRGRKLLERYLP